MHAITRWQEGDQDAKTMSGLPQLTSLCHDFVSKLVLWPLALVSYNKVQAEKKQFNPVNESQ